LQPYEQSLKAFQYKQALTQAISTKNPEVVLALLEELIERGALEKSLANRSPGELASVLDFLSWKFPDHRYSSLLLDVLRVLLDLYSAPLALC
jgi:U3 small nucleolar RNA-associated protein 15